MYCEELTEAMAKTMHMSRPAMRVIQFMGRMSNEVQINGVWMPVPSNWSRMYVVCDHVFKDNPFVQVIFTK